MALVLWLVETRTDGKTRGADVLEISRPGDLCDVATLRLTLPEAKQLLAGVQQAVVAAQARGHAALRLKCSGCGARCHVKGVVRNRVTREAGLALPGRLMGVVQIRVTLRTRNPFINRALSISGVAWKWQPPNHAPVGADRPGLVHVVNRATAPV
jgi:hypothetical protein